jgi:hypothetical protein
VTGADSGLIGDGINALEMLAGHTNGCPKSEMKAKGFTIGLLGGLSARTRLRRSTRG